MIAIGQPLEQVRQPPAGVTFRYSELYDWAAATGAPGQPVTTTGTLTATNAAPEATAAVYLPLVEQAVGAPSIQAAQALTTSAATSHRAARITNPWAGA